MLHLKGTGIEAQGYESSRGFVVRKGSKAKTQIAPSAHDGTIRLRNDLIKQEVLTIQDDIYAFTQDYVFNSPSLAASILLGRNANGRIEWKDQGGRTLKELQLSEAHQGTTE